LRWPRHHTKEEEISEVVKETVLPYLEKYVKREGQGEEGEAKKKKMKTEK
jgi:hypothetical protein